MGAPELKEDPSKVIFEITSYKENKHNLESIALSAPAFVSNDSGMCNLIN